MQIKINTNKKHKQYLDVLIKKRACQQGIYHLIYVQILKIQNLFLYEKFIFLNLS